MTIKIINATSGEIIEREMNAEELQQWKNDREIARLENEAKAAKHAAKQAVLDKLGLTADEVAALLG